MDSLDLRDMLLTKFSEDGDGPEEYNCWNAVREILHRARGVWMPMYSDYIKDVVQRDMLICSIRDSQDFKKLDGPEPWAIVTLNKMDPENPQCITHMGIVVSRRRFFQTRRVVGPSIEDMDRRRWVNRIRGYYRYVGQT